MTDCAAGLQKAVERHMSETNGISSGKNTEETYIIISNICLFWCLYETDLGICLIFLWTWNVCDASDREYTDRMLYNWNLSAGRILYVLLLEEMDQCSYTVKKQQHKLRTAYPTILYQSGAVTRKCCCSIFMPLK